jgi:hypothetical protein
MIVVVMGTTDRTGTATTLINFAYSYFAWLPLKSQLPYPAMSAKSDASTDMVMVPLWQLPYFRIGLEVSRGASESPWGVPPGYLVDFLASQELGRLPLPSRGGS